MRALALLLLFAVACSPLVAAHDCPIFLHKADHGESKQLEDVGLAAFRTHISEFCDRMPAYVTEPWYFNASE